MESPLTKPFTDWWKRPLRARERKSAFIIGAICGIFIGMLLCYFVMPDGTALKTYGYWAFGGMFGLAFIGVAYPRVLQILLFPIYLMGFG